MLLLYHHLMFRVMIMIPVGNISFWFTTYWSKVKVSYRAALLEFVICNMRVLHTLLPSGSVVHHIPVNHCIEHHLSARLFHPSCLSALPNKTDII